MKRISLLTIILVFGSLIILQSCEKDEIKDVKKTCENVANIKTDSTDYTLKDYEIRAFALNYAQKHFTDLKNIEIEKVTKLKSDVKSKIIYAVSFNPDAYILLSDDKRDMPIYGFSDKADFTGNDFDALNPSLNGWLHNLTVQNLIIEKDVSLQEKYHTQTTWHIYINLGLQQKIIPEQCDERFIRTTTQVNVPEMLTTRWGQGAPYNLQTPASNNCTHALTGCVATAVAQIIKNIGTPSYLRNGSYYVNNTASLNNQYQEYDTSSDAYQVANLMRIVGENVNMSYGCVASSAYSSDAKDYFEYLYPNNNDIAYVDYHVYGLIDNLDAGNPTYMRGQNSQGSGHAWVADGYLYVYDEYERVCPYGLDGTITGTIGRNFYPFCHMNWGWKGVNNGWFSNTLFYADPFTPDYNGQFNDFIYQNKMIINIHP